MPVDATAVPPTNVRWDVSVRLVSHAMLAERGRPYEYYPLHMQNSATALLAALKAPIVWDVGNHCAAMRMSAIHPAPCKLVRAPNYVAE